MGWGYCIFCKKSAQFANKVQNFTNYMYVLASLCITAGENGMADGYALWKNRLATEMVNNATKNLPPTEGPSHFVLTAHEELPKYFPSYVVSKHDFICDVIFICCYKI